MKKISITLLLCLLCLTGMAQGQKALDLKDITSGRFRPENIQRLQELRQLSVLSRRSEIADCY